MGDLIDRQAAIKSIQECADAAHDNYEWDVEEGYLNSIDCIEALPPSQQGWIPVTERLPEKDGEYLVTIDWGDGDTEVDCYDYCANGTDWNDGDLFGAKVLAWMPLPTPYREGGQDDSIRTE